MNKEDSTRIVETTTRIQTNAESIVLEPGEDFVTTPHIDQITERALAYLEAGCPVHFAGPAGTGKTTLAFHVAAKLGRPVVLIHGDDEFESSDLVGREAGYQRYKMIDNFIHTVLETREEMRSLWIDNRLTTACQNGYTLIYDEFNRSRAEANNALLSILSERVLSLPRLKITGEGYLEVHPDFRAIFTSNPEEYAGTHKTQDALIDRLITIHLSHYDRETEIDITMSKSGILRCDAEVIVDIVRELRGIGVNNRRPTIRAAIAIARVMARRSKVASLDDPMFELVCRDVLNVNTAKVTRDGESLMVQKVGDVIRKICKERKRPSDQFDQITAAAKE